MSQALGSGSCSLGVGGGGVGRVGLLVPPFARCSRGVRGCWVLVGLLFEICIVDASIFVASPAPVGPCWLWVGVEQVALIAACLCDCRRWVVCVVLTLLRQAMKGTWWMPWHQEPMKDVGACDKPWGVGNRAVIRGCPNGETQHESCRVTRT